MTIDRIAATALKGKSFAHDLSPVTLFIGPNDIGKSARLDAIRLALLGFLPELGKTNAATFTLSNASKMKVEAAIRGRPALVREWKQSGKGVKLTSAGIDGLPETPLVLLNADEYLERSDAARVQMIFDVMKLDAADWKPAAIGGRVTAKVPNALTLLRANGLFPGSDETIQAWLTRMADDAAEDQKAANAEALRFERTAQGITSLSLEEQPVDAQRVAADLQAARAKLGELREEHGRLKAQVEQQEAAAGRVRQIGVQIAALEAELGARPLPLSPEETRTRLAGLLERRGRLQAEHAAASAALESQAAHATRRAEIEKQIAALSPAADNTGTLEAHVRKLDQELSGLPEPDVAGPEKVFWERSQAVQTIKARIAALDEQQAKADAVFREAIQKPKCPTCGRAGKDWRAAMEEQHRAELVEIKARRLRLEAEHQEAQQLLEAATESHNLAIKTQQRRQAVVRQLDEAQMDLARSQAAERTRTALRGELEAISSKPGQSTAFSTAQAIMEVNEQVAAAQDDQRRLELAASLEGLRQELAQLQVPGDEDVGEQAARCDDEIEAQAGRIADLEAEAQKAANQAADQKRLAEAAQEKAKAEATSAELGKLREAIEAERRALIDAAFGPLLKMVNKFTAGILPSPMEFQNGELGRYEGASWVPVRAFGGCHKAISHAGIQAALGASGPAKIVMVDELGRFDFENKRRFLNNVAGLIQTGDVDQFIGADVSADAYASAMSKPAGPLAVIMLEK